MADGTGFSPDNTSPIGTESNKNIKTEKKSVREISPLSRGFEIWNDETTKIYYPENPLVPSSEGAHFRVESEGVPMHPRTPEEWKAWNSHWAKTIGIGKVISEGKDLPDMWQSFIGKTEFSPEGHLITEVIGRNPSGESWGKTAPLPEATYDNSQNKVSQDVLQKFKDTLGQYFDRFWIPYINNIELFSQVPNVSSPGSPEFEKVYKEDMNLPSPSTSEPMIVSDQFNIVAILNPHLKSGIHFMVDLPDAPRRPWRNLIKSLESLDAAEAAAQLLEENNFQGKPLAAWTSVRATGSWFGGFQELAKDEHFKDENISRKWLKREYAGEKTRLGEGKDWNMYFHPHIYGARNKDDLIKLTQRPKGEGGADWEGIVAMTKGERLFARDLMNEKLVPTLMSNARGKIYNS